MLKVRKSRLSTIIGDNITFSFFLFSDKNELIVFKSCITNFMICLRCLRFLLYLPAETKLENIDLYWFNLSHHTVEYEINGLMVLYTVPYLLNSQRQVYNHTFGRQSTINNSINHIEWIIDRDPLSIDTTLTHFQYVNSLVLFFDIKVNIQYKSMDIFIYLDCLGNEYKRRFLACITSIFTSSET
jgi:hypothetical protein